MKVDPGSPRHLLIVVGASALLYAGYLLFSAALGVYDFDLGRALFAYAIVTTIVLLILIRRRPRSSGGQASGKKSHRP